ncbi:MAG TPA: hypothetical protein VKY44_03965 [Flavobacterium sp.]|nr:hypothetical protein [Flavobacterium sp.]
MTRQETKRLGECLAQMQTLMQEVQGILNKNEIGIPKLSKKEQTENKWRSIIRNKKSPVEAGLK